MVTVTVIWVAAAAAIIMDGAVDTVITTAGRAAVIATITNTCARSRLGGFLLSALLGWALKTASVQTKV